MSDEQRYSTVPVADQADIDLEEVAASYGRPVVLDPPVSPDGTQLLIGFCGNKPRTLYGYPTHTDAEVKAMRSDPDSPWYIDPAIAI